MVALPQWATPAAGYGVPGDSVPPALPPALTSAVQPAFKGPYKEDASSGPGGPYPQQSVPVKGPSVPDAPNAEFDPEFTSQQADAWYSNPGFTQGPWPVSERPGEPLGVSPDDGLNTYSYPIGVAGGEKGLIGAVHQEIDSSHSNLESQNTDEHGWQVNTPAARTGVRQKWWQDYDGGSDPFWYDSRVRPTPQRIAQTAIPLNGTLAEYGGNFGAGGNLRYETPAAPATSTIASPPSGDAGPNGSASNGLTQWGEW